MKAINLFERIDWLDSNYELTVDDVISIIRDGTLPVENKRAGYRTTLKEVTEYMQNGLPSGASLQDMKREYLPAVSFNGTFQNGLITQYSDVTALDFDHIPNQGAYSDLYYALMATPCVRNIYRTPSGKGLKAIILHDNQVPGLHGNLYRQLHAMFKTEFISADPKCGDLFRRNYICYDPDGQFFI